MPANAFRAQLSPAGQVIGARPGFERCCSSVEKGHQNRHGFDPKKVNIWGVDILASQAEYLVADQLGLPWTGRVQHALVDVGRWVQVRWSPTPEHGLIVRPGDDWRCEYVFVTGGLDGEFIIWGMKPGWLAKVDEYWRGSYGGRPGAWFVPCDQLLSIWDVGELKSPAQLAC